jgi:hypothetical protein
LHLPRQSKIPRDFILLREHRDAARGVALQPTRPVALDALRTGAG